MGGPVSNPEEDIAHMKPNTRCKLAIALTVAGWLNGAVHHVAAASKEAEEAQAAMKRIAAEQRAAAEAREKDPAWKPSRSEVGLIQIGNPRKPGALKNFCLNAEGNILACVGSTNKNPSGSTGQPSGIHIYSPKGLLLRTLPLRIMPEAICVAKDGSIFVAGEGQVLKLDPAGNVLASAASPVANIPVAITKEIEEMLRGSGRSMKEEKERMQVALRERRTRVTGLAVTDRDLFMAVPAPNDFTFRVYRYDLALGGQKLVVEKLRGCCGQMDIQSHDGKLWIPHNARHCVETRDREGAEVSKFGKAGKVKAGDFGGCCEPKNMRVLPNGDVLAAESGPPTCIKRFSANGKFQEVIAVVNSTGECVRVTVEMSPDGSRYYLLDTTLDAIRVFGTKS